MAHDQIRPLKQLLKDKLQSPYAPLFAFILCSFLFVSLIATLNAFVFLEDINLSSILVSSSFSALLLWGIQKYFFGPTVTPLDKRNRLNPGTLKSAIEQQDIVAFTDAAGRIVEVNENFCQISKYKSEELIGQTHALLNSGYHSESFYKDLYKTIKLGRPWRGIFCNKAKDGSLYWVDSIIYPQVSSSGDIEGFLAIRHNITEQVNLLETSAIVQKRMELLLEHLPLGVIEMDSECNIKQLNPTFAKILGYSHASLVGKSIYTLIHPDDLEASKDLRERLSDLTTSQSKEARKRYLRKDGSTIWVRVTVNRLSNGHYIAAVENIQQLVEQETEIKRNADQLENVYALSKDIIGITNFDGTVLFANKAYEEITGFAIDELRTMPAFETLHPQDVSEQEKTLLKIKSGAAVMWESRLKTRDGDYRLIHWNSVPNLNEKIYYSIGRDITNVRENELKVMNASKMASLSQVASGVAHEINNPLAIIRGRVEIIKRQLSHDTPDLAKIHHSLNNTDEMVTRIASIVESLRIFSSPSGSSEYLEDLWIQPLLGRTIGFFLERLKKKNIEHSILISDQDIHFLGRSRELSHAISMLISNCIDAIDETSSEAWIKIYATNENNALIIKVQDSGRGISQEIQTKIMEPFFSTKPQAMGLGLSVANGLIAGHGGTLKIDPTEKYTTFVITIPHANKSQLIEEIRKAS